MTWWCSALTGSNDSASFQIERRSKIGNQRPFAYYVNKRAFKGGRFPELLLVTVREAQGDSAPQ